jgi:membrane-bound metal-dependent hydrolase YbcI (DUF457 family)
MPPREIVSREMPSPLGHALGGLATGWLIDRPRDGTVRQWGPPAALFALAGALPDVDLLFGVHRGAMHGVGAVAIAGLFVWGVTRRGSFAIAVASAYASHILLDWLGADTSAPVGVMALWPFSRAYYESGVHLFPPISRRYWLPEFWSMNLHALGRELVILGPIAVAIALWRRPRGSNPGRASLRVPQQP